MNGGIPVHAISDPFTSPANPPTRTPAQIGTSAGRSVSPGKIARKLSEFCARLAATIADSASTEPDERSMPAVMITCVTPIASRPTIDTCSTMICNRCGLNRKLCPRSIQPSASKISAMPTSTSRMLASVGMRNGRRRGATTIGAALTDVSMSNVLDWGQPEASCMMET